MKKLKILLLGILLILTTGCFNNDSMDNIEITTTMYPFEYVVNYLYGNHSKITSIYPKNTETNSFEVTNILLKQYKNTDLYIFNGLTNEKDYIEKIKNDNKKLKIIDVTSNTDYKYSMEELWLDPNNLLSIANNIKKGFNEYITSSYLKNEINENYENLKIELTNLDGKYYSTVKKASTNTIVVSDDAFKYLEKYGLNVISIDMDTAKDKDIELAKEALSNNNYLFIKYKEEDNDNITKVINTKTKKMELYTLTNLSDIAIDKNDYLILINQNLENLKQVLYQ